MIEPTKSDHLLVHAAVSFLQLVGSGKVREAFDRHVGANFRHHNPFFRGDRESLLNAMEESDRKNPRKVIDVKRSLEDESCVVVLSHIRQHPEDSGSAAIHIFRFESGRIAEMWDVGQAIPPESPNEHGAF